MITNIYTSTQVLDKNHVLASLESNLAMIEFNLEGKVIWVNENFAQTLGYQVDEMKKMRHSQFCTIELQNSKEYADLWANLRNGNKFQAKIQRVGKAVNLLWLEATYIPVLNEVNEVYAVLKIATDITEREKKTIEIVTQLKNLSFDLGQMINNNPLENIKAMASSVDETINKMNINVDNIVKEVIKVSEVTESSQQSVASTQHKINTTMGEFDIKDLKTSYSY
ncbi:MAG TPA: PAS domain-containing protein [Metabacillus sp.]|nr:PAS domain-containing protein [Metabacillus sp.]